MTHDNSELIPVGRISGTHGIRGQLKLHSYSGNLDSLQSVGQVILRAESGIQQAVTIRRAAYHSGKILLTLAGLDDINQALGLVGHELCLRRDQFPATDDGEYYWQDLLGLLVVTDNGYELGKLTDIMETGANDVYLIKKPATGKEYLIPAIADVIRDVDLALKVMTVTPLDGMLDL